MSSDLLPHPLSSSRRRPPSRTGIGRLYEELSPHREAAPASPGASNAQRRQRPLSFPLELKSAHSFVGRAARSRSPMTRAGTGGLRCGRAHPAPRPTPAGGRRGGPPCGPARRRRGLRGPELRGGTPRAGPRRGVPDSRPPSIATARRGRRRHPGAPCRVVPVPVRAAPDPGSGRLGRGRRRSARARCRPSLGRPAPLPSARDPVTRSSSRRAAPGVDRITPVWGSTVRTSLPLSRRAHRASTQR